MIIKYDNKMYRTLNRAVKLDDFILSSQKSSEPRIYKVNYIAEDSVTVIGKYSNGHTSLNRYTILEEIVED